MAVQEFDKITKAHVFHGLRPYVLIEVESFEDGDEPSITFSVKSGGGVDSTGATKELLEVVLEEIKAGNAETVTD